MLAFLFIFLALGRLYRQMFKQPETRALLVIALLIVAVGVLFYTQVEGWGLLDAIYFCIVTLGTVGFGDITPTTDLGKVFTIVYIIVGLSVIGGFFAAAGRALQAGHVLEKEQAMLEHELHRDEPPTKHPPP
jgi:hypothetical protein